MSDLFAGKYHVTTVRLRNWDYSSQGVYFVTICTKDKKPYFGTIKEPLDGSNMDSMHSASPVLSPTTMGQIAREEWLKTPDLRPDMNIMLGEFIIMPDHMHGVIGIGKNEYNRHPPARGATPANSFAAQSKNLAAIIRGYKSAVTTFARKNNIEFAWQRRYHEHFVRSEEDYCRIEKYIIENPERR